MEELIYLNDSFDDTVDRLVNDDEFEGCELNKENVSKTLISFQGDEIAASVFLKKYALRNNDNVILEFTLEEAKDRWAKAILEGDKKFNNSKDEKYFRELYDHFLPAGRQMFALGNEYVENMTFSNCYVTDIEEDSIEGIYDAAKKMAKTYSYGGGVGLCLGKLRPKKSRVSNTSKFSTGAVSFMELYSMTTGLIGQCIAEGQKVLTDNGLKNIEEIKINDKVWTRYGFKRVINTFNNGNKEVYKVKDVLGFELKCSKDHIIAVECDGEIEEKRIENLKVGDSIVLLPGTVLNNEYVNLNTEVYSKKTFSNKSNKLNENVNLLEKLNEKLAYILGYSYGDGSVEYDRFEEPYNLSLCCSDDWPEVKNKLISYIKDVFNYDVKIRKGDGRLDILTVFSKIILYYLKNNGLLKQKSTCLTFPEKILNSPSSVQMAFISGVFDADGKKINGKCGYCISITSYDFLKQIKNILMANGVVSRNLYENRENFGWSDLYSISVTGTSSQELALKLLHESVKVKEANFISKRDSYLTPFKSKSFSINYNKYEYINNKNYLSGRCFNKLKKDGAIKNENIMIKSFIKSIDYVGDLPTYDIQLEDEHMFFCEGFYVHNSGRRGALLLSLPVDHPDIEDFIEIKHNNINKVKNANISIKITDEFMKSVIEDKDFTMSFNTKHENITKTINARILWNKIVQSARDSAEPGILFYDTAKRMSTSDVYPGMEIRTTNPCGELWLEKNSACVLSSLILHTYVKNPFTDQAEFDFELFGEMINRGIRHLDNIVELNYGRHALSEQNETSRKGRRIGLGITGLADMLAALKIKYDSSEALEFVDSLMEFKMINEYNASIDLAKERGSFLLYDAEKHFTRGFCVNLPNEIINKAKKFGLRNISISTIAPSGSLSIIAQSSSGCEPIFALSYNRKVMLGKENFKEFSIKHQGVVRFFNTIGEENLPDYWVTAHNINYKNRIKMQATLQKYIDSSISSTINLPKDATTDCVGQIYMDAWLEGLKGLTVYREGSREGILTTGNENDSIEKSMDSIIYFVKAEKGDKFYITISYENRDVRKPYQVFVNNYKRSDTESFIKIGNSLVKMLLEKGVDSNRVQKYLDRSNNSLVKLTRFLSLSMKTDNLDNALEILNEYGFAGTLASNLHKILSKSVEAKSFCCPICKSVNVRMQESCVRCLDCNWEGCN